MNYSPKVLSFIDIFRFAITQDSSSSLERNIDESKQCYKINCLDLSKILREKKIIEDKDSEPWDKLQEILFERLMIEDYSSITHTTLNIAADSPNFGSTALGNDFKPGDNQILRYLYGCYYRLHQIIPTSNEGQESEVSAALAKAETLIVDQVVLYLTQPDLFPDREKRFKNNQPSPLLLNLVNSYFSKFDESHMDTIQRFVNQIGDACRGREEELSDNIITPTYARLSQRFVSMVIDDPTLATWFSVARVFIQQSNLARKFLELNTLKKDNSVTYQSTLLGFMMSISPLPRTSQSETTFFKNPAGGGESDHKFTETQLGIKLNTVGQELHKIFHSLLKLQETRNWFLSWIGRCLHTFKDRKKLWNNQLLMTTTTLSVNDGFLMNFLTVMLHLSEPFAGPYSREGSAPIQLNKRLLKVDPRYCKWSKANHEESTVHILGLSEETFLIKLDGPENPDTNFQPNFISECFFGAHQAFTYGFRSIYERFFKLAQNINDLQRAHQDAVVFRMQNPAAPSGRMDPVEILRERINLAMTQFFNLKAVLMEPNRVNMQMYFCIATAAYLNHLVACKDIDEALSATDFKTITLETLRSKSANKVCLEFMPEMLVENVLDFFIFLKHFNEQALSRASNILEPLMTLIITFMGNPSLMQNPHLRARFAEILECLMPHHSHVGQAFIGCPELFNSHPLTEELVPSLVSVFVSIEVTGEGVQFEQKFSYRRPMYIVLEYLWTLPLHRRILIELAQTAEREIDSARPPLFLRFINLLMNDAIFLLDEALNYMNQLREAERKRKTEEWQRLTPQQRAQTESTNSHIGRLARFHNVLSLSTIGTLAWLTSEIKTIFCHPTLVNRIANMLNYFLEHLVGPKKAKFNVEDKNDYEFKPREVLQIICAIYIHLGQPGSNPRYREFCTAVSSDGRSYSDTLLSQAADILFRTGVPSLGTEFEELSRQVHEIAVKNQMDEIPSEDIPDTFLDPIMSTLMVDPVLLPSSKIIVDRSTIARHLLSDQTDPFNRSPLSMEDVIPQEDLKKFIETFLKDRRDAQRRQGK